MEQSWAWWVGFNLLILVLLAVDLGVFNRKSHEVGFVEALIWSVVWIIVALIFNLGIWQGWVGTYPVEERHKAALDFLQGYIVERTLSFDNLFVFAVIFSYFAVKDKYHHRVLFYGILGALIFRAVFIFGGLWLIQMFSWMVYVFGAFLIFTGAKLAFAKDEKIEPEKNPILRLARRFLPVSDKYDEGRFITRVDSRRMVTPMLLVLIFLESTDVMFAIDSIPAIIAITKDSFIVYTSNIFAILGLRATFFVLAAFMRMFHYLSYGLAVLLVFIGAKMLAEPLLHWKLSSAWSLGIIIAILTVAIVASLVAPPKTAAVAADPAHPGPDQG